MIKKSKSTVEHMSASGANISAAALNKLDKFLADISTTLTVKKLKVLDSFNYLPTGSIIAFNGSSAPQGWALCNGQNGTPDLRGRFIRMFNDNIGGKNFKMNVSYNRDIAGNSRTDKQSWILKHKFGDKAGTDHQVLITDELPAHSHPHTHRVPMGGTNNARGRSCVNNTGHCTDYISSGQTTSSNGGKSVGAGWGHNNQPPYYVLSYIMKL